MRSGLTANGELLVISNGQPILSLLVSECRSPISRGSEKLNEKVSKEQSSEIKVSKNFPIYMHEFSYT